MLSNTALTWLLLTFLTIFAFSTFVMLVLDYLTWSEWQKAKALTRDLERAIEDYDRIWRTPARNDEVFDQEQTATPVVRLPQSPYPMGYRNIGTFTAGDVVDLSARRPRPQD